ncbi:MAG TPA: Uma2 family endonuclease, partial [Rubrivivax sp.]|nr:Uma2 family endonuclease [Rubrivivax sp.]
MTADEFLAWDAGQTVKHEFVRGEVFAMAGGEDRHYSVALNLAVALHQHLRGTPCRTFGSDVKLRVEAEDCFFYPDLMVTCSAADAADRLIKR